MIATVFRGDPDELGRAGAEILLKAVSEVLELKGRVVLAIPGGRSVAGIWKHLGAERKIPWDKVHVFMADERLVGPEHRDSNYRLAFEGFLKGLSESGRMPEENAHPFLPEDSAGEYYAELKRLGGPDVLVLGVGEDGHVGALYPRHHSVESDAEGYVAMRDSPKPPPERITMTRRTMLKAGTAVLLFVGEGKKEAYARFLSEGSVSECPARIAKNIEKVYILTDIEGIKENF